MAPESERANLMIPANLPKCPSCGMALGHLPDCPNNDADQSEPLTCSEVVERLQRECFHQEIKVGERMCSGAWFDRTQAEAILHSWRERRVQELEEALRTILPWVEDRAYEDARQIVERVLPGSK